MSLWADNCDGKSKQCAPHKADLNHLLWHVVVSLNVSSQWASLHTGPHFLLAMLSTSSYGTDKLGLQSLKWPLKLTKFTLMQQNVGNQMVGVFHYHDGSEWNVFFCTGRLKADPYTHLRSYYPISWRECANLWLFLFIINRRVWIFFNICDVFWK